MAEQGSTEFVSEPSHRRPVVYDADVVVAGGGIAGVFAALGAARAGAQTVLIDRFGSPGGNFGPGMINAGSVAGKPVDTQILGGVTGIPKEFLDRHEALCSGAGGNVIQSNTASYLSLKMMEESGVHMLLSAYAADPIVDGNRLGGLFVETKSGRQAVKAKVVIDATGEADVARRAGGAVLYPKPEYTEIDHHSIGAGLYYVIGGVDVERWEQVREGQAPGEEDLKWVRETLGALNERYGYLAPFLKKAWEQEEDRSLFENGLFRRPIDGYGEVATLYPNPMKGYSGMANRCTGFVRVDMGDGVQVARAEAVARMCIFETVQFYRKYVPGFESAYLLCISPYFGARGGPCIEGERIMRLDDFVEGRRFPDVLYVFGHVSGGRDVEKGDGKWTDHPYRCMLPKDLEGLIAVGRSASAIPDTMIRGRLKAMHMGQLGGMAAAMAADKGLTPKTLDVKELQRAALAEGFYLGDEARLRELGLT